jgi:glycerate kinase
MKVLIAPDKFKGCLTAAEVAAAVAAGLKDARPDLETIMLPVADGGDGTVAAAAGAGYSLITVPTVGPTGEPITACYALDGKRAVIELAAVVGLDRLPGGDLEPLGASTYGLGVVIADALNRGATEIVLGLGGSASTDGGAGMVQALGGRLSDAAGRHLPAGGGALADLAGIDLGPVRAALGGAKITVATDVDNPLLGPTGAAAVFGPQKGAGPDELALLERGLTTWARTVAAATGRDDSARPGAGAAGGTGFAALAVLDAAIRPGIELVLELIHFADRLHGADLVITGEGSLDEQSLAGKAPVGVARAAGAARVTVVAVAGRSLLSDDRLRDAGIAAAYPLAELEPDPARSMAQASPLLREVGRRIAKDWLA